MSAPGIIGFDLGRFPDRPLDPPEPPRSPGPHHQSDEERARNAARLTVLREAGEVSFWLALFDDAEGIDDVDILGLASAMAAIHAGHEAGALEQLRAAASVTLQTLIDAEADECIAALDDGPDPDEGAGDGHR